MLAGTSAGSLCWSERGPTDSHGDDPRRPGRAAAHAPYAAAMVPIGEILVVGLTVLALIGVAVLVLRRPVTRRREARRTGVPDPAGAAPAPGRRDG